MRPDEIAGPFGALTPAEERAAEVFIERRMAQGPVSDEEKPCLVVHVVAALKDMRLEAWLHGGRQN